MRDKIPLHGLTILASDNDYPKKGGGHSSSTYPGGRKTSTSGYPEGASDGGDYKKTSHVSKSMGSSRDIRRSIRIGLKILVFIEVVVVIALISAIYTMAVKDVIAPVVEWPLEPVPGTGEFDEFAVSSSSELCSEFARSMYVEGYRSTLIAAMLQLCLSLQQPDRSGELGASVVVHYSPDKKCRYTRGMSQMPGRPDLVSHASMALSGDPYADSKGPYSELLPLDLITTLGLLENATAQELEELAILIKAEHGDKIIALTISKVNPVDWLHIMDPILIDKSEEFTRTEVGDVVTVPNFDEKMKHFVEVLKYKDPDELENYLRSKLIPDFLPYGDSFTSDFTLIDKAAVKRWTTKEVTTDSEHPRSYCYPDNPSVAKHIFRSMEEADAPSLTFDFKPDQATAALQYMINDLYRRVSVLDRGTAFYTLYMRGNESHADTEPLKANMFTLAVGEEAYSFVGTIGTSFGSRSTTPFMNNLAHNLLRNFLTVKGFANSLHPVIEITNNTVSKVYSGVPGYPTVSPGIPRLIYSLIMTTFFNYTLEEAVGYPLMYPQPTSDVMSRYYYPFQSQFAKSIPEGKKIKDIPIGSDSVSAISRRYDENGYLRYIPFYKNGRVLSLHDVQFRTR
ncbi:unnamed protein product [Cylicocyclus nassatus]|uniref:Uncharacterized protein n=1 Tax=Cylicocyclus nassatus TaxID=53992 RepID=A0AA36M568_CYLNA|nr:unnamed protein product [Cylicocyclus nassatus]